MKKIILLSSFFLVLLMGVSLSKAEHAPVLAAPIDFNARMLDDLNPIKQFSSQPGEFYDDANPDNFSVAKTINRALTFLFPVAGMILFVLITWGGFEMMLGAASKKNLDAGKQRVTAAVIGFLLLFSTYWIVQIIEEVTKVNILG